MVFITLFISTLITLSVFGSLLMPSTKNDASEEPTQQTTFGALLENLKSVTAPAQAASQVLGVSETTATPTETLLYWKNLVAQHPGYRDGWVQVLFSAYNAQDELAQEEAWNTLKHLDPLFLETVPEEMIFNED